MTLEDWWVIGFLPSVGSLRRRGPGGAAGDGDRGLSYQHRQQYGVVQLVVQLQEISVVRLALPSSEGSPYLGIVRRVRVLGQSERVMDVEVVLEAEMAYRKETLGDGADWEGGSGPASGHYLPNQPAHDQGAVWRDG